MQKYSAVKTLSKTAPPIVLIVLIQALKGALAAGKVEVSDDVLYSGAIALYGGFIGLKNWIKNRKKKPAEFSTDPEETKSGGKDPMQ